MTHSKNTHIVNFILGDYYNDGHGKYSENLFVSNFTMEEIIEAYEKSLAESGIDFEFICQEYEESSINSELIEKFLNFGIDMRKLFPSAFDKNDPYCDYNEEEGKLTLNTDYYTILLIEFIKKNLPSLSMEKLKFQVFPHFFGYGLFY